MSRKISQQRAEPRARGSVRRIGVSLLLGLVTAIQIPGCIFKPYIGPNPISTARPSGAADGSNGATKSTFAACKQHFPSYVPTIAWPGRQRALCFDSFAVLHSRESNTPVHAVEQLTRASVEAAKGLQRADRF